MVIKHNNVTINIYQFGRNTKGGYWYASFKYVGGEYDGGCEGVRRDTLRELCAWLMVSRTALQRDVKRVDY